MTSSQVLLGALLIPLLGSVVLVAVRSRPNLREAVTLTTSLLLALLIWRMVPDVLGGARFSISLAEIAPGLTIRLAVEPLGMLFAVVAASLWIVNSIYSIGYMRGNVEKHQTRFYAFFALSIFATMGIAFAGNMLTLFVFYELLTFSTYPLVAHKGDEKTLKSARVYMALLLATSMGLLLPAMIWTWVVAGSLEFADGGVLQARIAAPAAGVLLCLYFFGIGKAALMPFHRWLPAAMVAPTPVSALLHAVAVVKAGVFSIVKVAVYLFGADLLMQIDAVEWLGMAAMLTMVIAGVVALHQSNLKSLLAYSTVAQLAYVVLAVCILSPLSYVGGALHIATHAVGKITLFFVAGSIYTASKKTELDQLHGIGRRMPVTMTAFVIGALSMIGLPPTAGFVSKWYIVSAAAEQGAFLPLVAISLSTLLSAAYLLPIAFAAFFREEQEPSPKQHGEAPPLVVLGLSVTAALTLILFLSHQPLVHLALQMTQSWPI